MTSFVFSWSLAWKTVETTSALPSDWLRRKEPVSLYRPSDHAWNIELQLLTLSHSLRIWSWTWVFSWKLGSHSLKDQTSCWSQLQPVKPTLTHPVPLQFTVVTFWWFVCFFSSIQPNFKLFYFLFSSLVSTLRIFSSGGRTHVYQPCTPISVGPGTFSRQLNEHLLNKPWCSPIWVENKVNLTILWENYCLCHHFNSSNNIKSLGVDVSLTSLWHLLLFPSPPTLPPIFFFLTERTSLGSELRTVTKAS